jgi:hypothetical protein
MRPTRANGRERGGPGISVAAAGLDQRLVELPTLEIAHVAERRVGDHLPDAAAQRGGLAIGRA